jgi:ParB family transcriptional regulator, chromosome partitioning protein
MLPTRSCVPRTATRPASRATFDDLDAALDARPPVDDRLVHSLPMTTIRPSPRNPRQKMDVDELKDSLDIHGLLQAIVVRRRGTGYELIAGHRRYEAAKQLGWESIDAKVLEKTPAEANILTLVENLQREDLTPNEEAEALGILMHERGWSVRKVADAIKRDPMYVSRRLRVFEDPVLRQPVLEQRMPVSTAEVLLRADPEDRPRLVEEALANAWGQMDARRAVSAERRVTLQSSPRLASRIRALHDELAGLDLAALPTRTKRELARLVEFVST